MAEWSILLLLVPAVVVPVVFLVGFAGCDLLFGVLHVNTPPPVPVIVSVKGKSVAVITLTWTYSGSAAEFEFERMKRAEQTRQTFKVAASPHEHDDDNEGHGLAPETDYLYRVRAIGSDGEPGEWSSDEPNILGTTLPFVETFAWTDEELAGAIPNPLQGTCIIQRIDKARLSTGGGWVRLTLGGSQVGSASIDAISISRPDLTAGKDPYDSDTVPTPVTPKVFVTANSLTLPAIKYDLDPEQDLLIAIEFSGIAPSTIKKVNGALGASAFYKAAAGPGPTGEAANRDRTGFLPAGAVMYLVERIEVG
jgi:hypothetical protein